MNLWAFDPVGETIYLCKTLKNLPSLDMDSLDIEISDLSGFIGLKIDEKIYIIDVENFKLC